MPERSGAEVSSPAYVNTGHSQKGGFLQMQPWAISGTERED